MVEYHAVSMKRYARELAQFLPQVAGPNWEFEELTYATTTNAPCGLFGPKFGPQMASRAGRFVSYPKMAKQAVGRRFPRPRP